MTKAAFQELPANYRNLMDEIDPEDFYVFEDNLTSRAPMSCILLDKDASAQDLARVQRDQGGARGHTLLGRDLRMLLLTVAQAHGFISRSAFVDLKSPVEK